MATLIAPDHSFAIEDAEVLRKAVQGLGTDEKAIISIIGYRNAVQRKQIRQAYEENYQEDLIKRFESELSGNFEKAVYRWMLEPADRDAVLANVALRNVTQDYRVIIEIACVDSPHELFAVKQAYHLRYKRSLEEDVALHTKGHFRQLLVALVSTYRYGGDEINASLASEEANILQKAINGKHINHEETVRILGTRSKAQLNATFSQYKIEYGTSITKNLRGGPDDEFLAALLATIQCIYAPQKYFAKVLHNAMHKVWTDKDAVTHVIVTHAEKDLKEIKELYCKKNNMTLEHAIDKETSGDYKAFLITLLGTQNG
ncbi:annexin-like protein RJ4 isoform X3 [Macadamia integrifolia]|uniref:annexin-like protein RJ4 isoform X3 n=1 Tax=Macadamia integrifolia TaxID=60698 RepID=UPI001C530C1C|nr:annexin-like protein RJ4 isoform X3 [Macadamia integrifolia]